MYMERKMRIVQINETCGTGSIGRTTAEFAQACHDMGHESYVFYASGKPTYKNSKQIGNVFFQKLHALLSRITGKQGYASYIPTIKLIKELETIQPDIVHLRNLHANYINLRLLLQYLAKNDIATVLTLHDCWFFTGKCTYYISANCNKWKEECGNCPLLHEDNVNPTLWFDSTKACLHDKQKWFSAIPRLAVVGVSQWVASEASMSFLGRRNPIGIYNWIDTNVFQPRETQELREKNELNEKFVVLMVTAGISEKKGYLVLKALSEKLSSEYQLIVIGKNPRNLEIPENVIHIQHTNDAVELSKYYSMADVCVNTTKYETFGKVTAEALCCGTPVIVYNNTASPELVGPGCGYVIDETAGYDDVVKAVESIRKLGKENMTADCLSFSRKMFSKENGIQKYIELYNKLLEK